MNPEFIKSEISKLEAMGFKQDLVVLKHDDGRVSVLTSLMGGPDSQVVLDAYANSVHTIVAIIHSIVKVLARPGMNTDMASLMLRHIEADVRRLSPHFTVNYRPTVEPDLEKKFKTTDGG